MADTGWVSPTSGVNVAGPNADWSSASNITADDSVFARCQLDGTSPSNFKSDVLQASGYDFGMAGDESIYAFEVRLNWKSGIPFVLGTMHLDMTFYDTTTDTPLSDTERITLTPVGVTETNTDFPDPLGPAPGLWNIPASGFDMWPENMNNLGIEFVAELNTFSGKIVINPDWIAVKISFTQGKRVRIKGKTTLTGGSKIAAL